LSRRKRKRGKEVGESLFFFSPPSLSLLLPLSPLSIFPCHPPPARAPDRKVELVSEETDALRAALDKHSHRERRRAADDVARAELLSGRGEAYAWSAAADADAAAASSVRSSKRMVQEALATGGAALAAMAGQRDTLKRAQRKALDVVHGLGLSDSLLRLIERRQKLDSALAYGGMAVVTLVVLWAWWHFKR
jgi:golgi SNAP receptor complex member 2